MIKEVNAKNLKASIRKKINYHPTSLSEIPEQDWEAKPDKGSMKSLKEKSEYQFIRKFLEKAKNIETIEDIFSEIIYNQQDRNISNSNTHKTKYRKSRSKSIGQLVNEWEGSSLTAQESKATLVKQLTVVIPKKVSTPVET